MDKMFTVFVVWRLLGDDFMLTSLDYDDTPEQRQAMLSWSMLDYIQQAFDKEFPEDNPEILEEVGWEVITIIEGTRVVF